MSPRHPTICTHERRPGTTICLLCRQEERAAAQVRREHLAKQLLVVGAGVAAVVFAVSLAVSAVRGRRSSAPVVVAPAPTRIDRPVPEPTLAGEPALRLPPLLPMIAAGRTELGDGMYAERTGDTVVVHFDVTGMRTRRRDKFERTVRATLPRVYGPAVDSVVDFPREGLAPGRDLIRDLAGTGIRVPLARGMGALTVVPRTRIGQDGPLVVGYRATLAP